MDLVQFPHILEDILTDLFPRIKPLIDTTTVLPQIREVIALKRKLTKSYRALRDAQRMIPDVIDSIQLHALEEGSVPNNVRAGVAERIREQAEREREHAAAAAYVNQLRARGDNVIPMPFNRRSPQPPAEGGRRKTRRRIPRRR